MSKPIVAIIGRPNVGESTLFNVIAGDTISTAEGAPGVTRDWIYADCEWLNINFTLTDTDGIELDSKDIVLSQMREQAKIAISTTDVIVFIVNMRQGLVDADSKVTNLLHKPRKPVMLAADKVDSVARHGNGVYEFYNLGTGNPITVSAALQLGVGDLLDEVVRHFDLEQMEEEGDERPGITVVGKPDMGKSSTIDRLLDENRAIMSDTAGATRDAVDTEAIHEGTPYVFIDTAGLYRKNKIKEELERYNIIRTVSAVERADVVTVVMNAMEGVTEQDAKIAGITHERGKGIIVAINKWDAIEKTDKIIYEYIRKIKEVFSFIPYAKFLFISAATGQRLIKLFEMIDVVCQSQNPRVATGVLSEIVTEAVTIQQPPSDKGKWLKAYHMTQVAVKPPAFVILANDKELIHFSYARYLENQIRNAFGFKGTSLEFLIRERKGKEQ